MSAHDEAIEAANDAVGALHGGQKPGLRDIEVCVRAYLAAMAERDWKMTPRACNAKMAAGHIDDYRLSGNSWARQWEAAPSPGDEG